MIRFGCRLAAAALLVAVVAVHAAAEVVSLVASDDPALAQPAARDAALTTAQVEALVRRAVDLAGGMAAHVPADARLVVIKPNISIAQPRGSGIVTDARLVRAVALQVHESAPRARILIGEAPGGWIGPETAQRVGYEVSFLARWMGGIEQDGFAVGGYREVAEELRGRGVDIACLDMNWSTRDTLRVDGGLADDEYVLAGEITAADAWINCPVLKTHGPKITVAMKNRFGILPGSVYGISKNRGTLEHGPMPHRPAVVQELMVDLWRLAPEALVVVDGIVGHEEGGLTAGDPVRTNQVLAGRNPVAVDLTAAALMGYNPDDLELAALAARVGAGPRRFEAVEVRGDSVERLQRRFRKAGTAYRTLFMGSEWERVANYGMGPRYWLLTGPLAADAALAPDTTPVPGQGGWSEPVWFGHDRIDLDAALDDPAHCAAYAFTWFTMARSDSVRFWAGSDEGMRVWIDGQQVYAHDGRRDHELGQDRVAGYLEAGEHRLLVRVEQGRGPFEFSFNICEPIDDPLYAGNTYPGLRSYPDRARPEDF